MDAAVLNESHTNRKETWLTIAAYINDKDKMSDHKLFWVVVVMTVVVAMFGVGCQQQLKRMGKLVEEIVMDKLTKQQQNSLWGMRKRKKMYGKHKYLKWEISEC